MPYTFEDAKAEVGESADWELGRQASIKKWEQIAAGDEDTYPQPFNCGLCFVCGNREIDLCKDCPAHPVCDLFTPLRFADPQEVIDALKQLELPEGMKK